MTFSRRSTVIVGLCALFIPFAFEAYARVTCYGPEGWAGDLLILGPSLLIALGCLATSNPLRSVGASLGLTVALGFAYHSECIRPYEGGGASFIGLILFFAAPVGAGVGAWIAETLCMIFRLRIYNPPLEAPDAR